MPYYIAKVTFESEETKRDGSPVVTTSQFLVPALTVLEVETKLASYLDGTLGSYETIQISKSKIEAVIE
jgi:hypothetical protein